MHTISMTANIVVHLCGSGRCYVSCAGMWGIFMRMGSHAFAAGMLAALLA
jgi:hypothetical protein